VADDVRFSTPELVADYRAERLKCDTIVDIGAGYGFQSFAFAKKCKKVYSIELNEQVCARAKENLAKLENVEVICGDALDPKVIEKIKKADIVFCDPERLPSEKERTMATIKPFLPDVVEKYSHLTNNFCFELPPHIRDIPFDCEKEYLSLFGKLNRLDIYVGDLKNCERSAILLPGEHFLRGKRKPVEGPLQKYLYEIDPAVLLAGLEGEIKGVKKTSNKYATADEEVESPYLPQKYAVLRVCSGHELKRVLRDMFCGKVIIRYPIDPQDYWKERNELEKGLSGKRVLHLFRLNEGFVVAKLIE